MRQEKISQLYEYIYGIFEPFEASFLNGEYNIHINGKVYKLDSREVAIVNNKIFDTFVEIKPFFDYITSLPDFLQNSIPNEYLTIVDYDYYKKVCVDFFHDNILLQKINYLTKHHYQCLLLKIPHKFEGEPVSYFNNFTDNNGLEKSLEIYLRGIKEFQDYHILSEAPHVYLSDIHFRKMNGIFSYCVDINNNIFTKVKPRLDCWTPKKKDDAHEKATEYFNAGNKYDIADMLMARARAYAEQKSYRLAILHAVMSLEIVVPKVTEAYLKHNFISQATIKDYENKFDLSIRIKIFLKIIFPNNIHEIIDKVGEAITIRNKIIHRGIQESSLDTKQINDLVNYCYIFKKLLSSYLSNNKQFED